MALLQKTSEERRGSSSGVPYFRGVCMSLALGPLVQWLSDFSLHQNHLESLSTGGPHPQISDSEDLRLGLRICISLNVCR